MQYIVASIHPSIHKGTIENVEFRCNVMPFSIFVMEINVEQLKQYASKSDDNSYNNIPPNGGKGFGPNLPFYSSG